jgi:hypothetical protein
MACATTPTRRRSDYDRPADGETSATDSARWQGSSVAHVDDWQRQLRIFDHGGVP